MHRRGYPRRSPLRPTGSLWCQEQRGERRDLACALQHLQRRGLHVANKNSTWPLRKKNTHADERTHKHTGKKGRKRERIGNKNSALFTSAPKHMRLLVCVSVSGMFPFYLFLLPVCRESPSLSESLPESESDDDIANFVSLLVCPSWSDTVVVDASSHR